MPSYTWPQKQLGMGFGGPGPPPVPGRAPFPEIDFAGLKDWLSSSMARQFMPGRLYPSQIGKAASEAYAPLLQMKTMLPLQKYEAGESARRFDYGAEADTWSKMLAAIMNQQGMGLQARGMFPGLWDLKQYMPGG